jgi:hypothetical protein
VDVLEEDANGEHRFRFSLSSRLLDLLCRGWTMQRVDGYVGLQVLRMSFA